MVFGPGRYDDFCTTVRTATNAEAVIVMVVGGNRGHGFSCQASFAATQMLPDFVEDMAKQIRADMGDKGTS
jgi:hypothetical protein